MLRTLLVLTMLLVAPPCFGQLDHEQEPINYSRTEASDRVAHLIGHMELGEIRFS